VFRVCPTHDLTIVLKHDNGFFMLESHVRTLASIEHVLDNIEILILIH